MGMHPRWILADIPLANTQRTVDRQFFFKPNPFTRNAIGASAARALQKFPVKIYWLEFNINHEQNGIAPLSNSKKHRNNVIFFTVAGAGTLSVDGDIEPGEYMEYKGGNTVTVYDENWNVLHTLPATATNFTVANGNISITTEAGSGSGNPDLKVQYITLDDVYVLESNKNM